MVTLKEPTIAPEHLFRVVAGEREKRRVRQYDVIVGPPEIGDDHWHARALDCDECQLPSVLQRFRFSGCGWVAPARFGRRSSATSEAKRGR